MQPRVVDDADFSRRTAARSSSAAGPAWPGSNERFGPHDARLRSGRAATGRFVDIDALRGVAALLVVWLHASQAFLPLPRAAGDRDGWYDLANLIGAGRMGVVAFFAISGFVIVPTVGRGRRAIARFVVKRLFRLYPLFWFTVVVAAAGFALQPGGGPAPGTVLANLTMFPLEFGRPQVLGHFWTLEVEWIFYALVVGLAIAGRLHDERIVAVFLVVIAIVWNVLYRTRLGPLTVAHNMVWTFLGYFLGVMFWGSMVRARRTPASSSTARADVPGRSRWAFAVVTALVFGRPLLALAFGSPTVNQEEWRGTLLGLLAFLFFVTRPAARLRWLAGLGTISYSLYLVHPLTFQPIEALATRVDVFKQWPLSMYVAASMLLTIALSAITYRCIERPANRWAHRFVERRLASDPKADPP